MNTRSYISTIVLAACLLTACSFNAPITQSAQPLPTNTSQPSPITPTAETSTPAVVSETPTFTATLVPATAIPTQEPTATVEPTATLKMETATIAPTSSDKVEPGSNVAITIANFSFDPTPLTVHVGTTVTWTNQDGVSHTVTADNGQFNSNSLKKGDTFSFTFTTEGTYAYYCKFHGGPGGDGMSGQVIVVP